MMTRPTFRLLTAHNRSSHLVMIMGIAPDKIRYFTDPIRSGNLFRVPERTNFQFY